MILIQGPTLAIFCPILLKKSLCRSFTSLYVYLSKEQLFTARLCTISNTLLHVFVDPKKVTVCTTAYV
jgi:hypothetical protein